MRLEVELSIELVAEAAARALIDMPEKREEKSAEEARGGGLLLLFELRYDMSAH